MSATKITDAETTSGYGQPFSLRGLFQQNPAAPLRDPTDEELSAILPVSALQDELDTLQDFLSEHLKVIANADVQCMLIWTEWVRFCFRRTKKFPRLILEQEFTDIVTGLFGTTICLDDCRGRVYPGLRFVP